MDESQKYYLDGKKPNTQRNTQTQKLYLNYRILFVEMAKWSNMFFLVRKAFRAWEMAFNYCNNLFFTLLSGSKHKIISLASSAKNKSFKPYFLSFVKALILSFDVEFWNGW